MASTRAALVPNLGLASLLCVLVGKLFWDAPSDPGAQLGFTLLGLTTLVLAGIVLSRPPARNHDARWWVLVLCALSMVYVLAYRYDPANAFMQVIFWGNITFRLLAQIMLLSLGTSYAMLPALRQVRCGFVYRVVRHPVYAMYMLADLTIVLLQPSLWNLGVAGVGAATFYLRSTLEERVLAHDPVYSTYMRHVPWRFIPGVV